MFYDVLKANIKTASVFSLLNSMSSFFKESHQRMNIWESISYDLKHRKYRELAQLVVGQGNSVKKNGELNKLKKIVYILMSLTLYKELKITLKLILKPKL